MFDILLKNNKICNVTTYLTSRIAYILVFLDIKIIYYLSQSSPFIPYIDQWCFFYVSVYCNFILTLQNVTTKFRLSLPCWFLASEWFMCQYSILFYWFSTYEEGKTTICNDKLVKQCLYCLYMVFGRMMVNRWMNGLLAGWFVVSFSFYKIK